MNLSKPMVAALLSVCAAAHAGIPVTQELECPLGGKKFQYRATTTSSTWGSRPDGKPYGSWTFPMPLPVCPDNGLVVFSEFSPEQIEQLAPLVASEEYQRMRATESPYYLAHWLMRELGSPRLLIVSSLLQASWESDANAKRKARYQQEFVAAAARE